MFQSECSVLSENLERRRQEAEELEGYCSQLKVSHWGVRVGWGEGSECRKMVGGKVGRNGVGEHKRGGRKWKSSMGEGQGGSHPFNQGNQAPKGQTKSRGQTWRSGCVLHLGLDEACIEIEMQGLGPRNGVGRQGPCPGVLTQENCRMVTRSVEDAEIKTNVLKQNSALLEVRGWSQDSVRGADA